MSIYEHLKEWQAKEGLTNVEAAMRADYSLSMYEQILYGSKRPSLERAKEFQEVTGVPASLFYPELEGLV